MVVRAVQSRRRKPGQKPVEQRFVADVHPQRDLWLLPVTTERALANQQAGDDASLERG